MKMKPFVLVLFLVGLALAGTTGWLYYQDMQFRQAHGTVVDVTYLNWKQEVEDVRDSVPVLLYFYDSGSDSYQLQKEEIDSFAWRNAGRVKVAACDVSKPENLIYAIAHGALRQPAFVYVYEDKIVFGPAGVITNHVQLEILLDRLLVNP